MSKKRSQPRANRQTTGPGLERTHIKVQIVAALIGILITTALGWLGYETLKESRTQNEATAILQGVEVVGGKEPEVAEPVVKALEEAGRGDVADVVEAVVEQEAKVRNKLTPILLPENEDSAAMVLADLQRRVDSQPALPSGPIVIQGDSSVRGKIAIEIVPIPRDSATARLPSGEQVSRDDLLGAVTDVYGRVYCAGSCRRGAGCCRMSVVLPP